MGGRGRAEIRNEIGKITGMIADAPIMNCLGEKVWNIQWMGDNSCKSGGMLVVNGLDVDRSAESQLVNMYVNIKEGDIRGGDG